MQNFNDFFDKEDSQHWLLDKHGFCIGIHRYIYLLKTNRFVTLKREE